MSEYIDEKCREIAKETGALLTAVVVLTRAGGTELAFSEEYEEEEGRYNVRFPTLLRELGNRLLQNADAIEARVKESSPIREKEKDDGHGD